MYDAIIVGARCAGASAAMLLARQGHRVLLVDRDDFPSDLAPSTHMVWHDGVARLKRWGLLDKLSATGCPPMENFSLDLGAFVLRGQAPPAGDVTQCYAPRRYVLDALLVEAAVQAGAELRRGSVSAPSFEDNRVVGVGYSDENRKSFVERARIVIGADGTNSTIARAVNAVSYNEQPQLSGIIYAYFRDLVIDGVEFYSRPGRMIFAWSTNNDLTLVGMSIRADDYRQLARDPESSFYNELSALAPQFHERVRGAAREGPWLKGATRNFCRKPAGAGWALVGDAGLTMDPITAAGITNAFRDAERLAAVVHDVLSREQASDEPMEQFERDRNAATLPLYSFTCEMAKLAPPPPEVIDLLVALNGNSDATNAYFGVFAQTVPVQDFFAPQNVERIIGNAAE